MSRARQLHRAFADGDLPALRALLGEPADFPNCPNPSGFGDSVLQYAIDHAPLALIARLLALGADPNRADPAGFPPLLAALSSARPDKPALLTLLLDAGARLDQRGINGYTPLHLAAAQGDLAAAELLLERGADPEARTDVDDYTTAVEEAELLGRKELATALRRLIARRQGG